MAGPAVRDSTVTAKGSYRIEGQMRKFIIGKLFALIQGERKGRAAKGKVTRRL